jgi:hypothetical protein
MTRMICRLFLSGVVALLPSLAFAAKEMPDKTPDGLVRVEDSKAAVAYVRPNTDWAKYKTVQISPLVIPQKVRNTAPKGERPGFGESFIMRDEDVAAIQKAYLEAMTEDMNKSGLTVVTTPSADTLVIASQLLNVTLNAPIESSGMNYAGRGRTYTQGAGSMAIAVVLADGESGTVVAEGADRSYSHSMWGMNTRVSNLNEARRAFRIWARELGDALKKRVAG